MDMVYGLKEFNVQELILFHEIFFPFHLFHYLHYHWVELENLKTDYLRHHQKQTNLFHSENVLKYLHIHDKCFLPC